MKSILQSTPFFQKESLNARIRDLVLSVQPEKIFLLSASYHYQVTENIFIPNPIEEMTNSRYQVLVLVNGDGKKSLAGQDIMVRTKLMRQCDLQVHLMDIHVFNKQLEEGDEWSQFILLNAMLFYDRGKVALSDPQIPPGYAKA